MTKRLANIGLLCVIFILSLSVILAQKATTSPTDVVFRAREASDTARYLAINSELKKEENLFISSPRAYSYFQLLAVNSSQIGEYQDALTYFYKSMKIQHAPFSKVNKNVLANYQPQNAIKFIETIADNRQVIMLNEGHNLSFHRAFAIRLLDMLYKKGFRYFAAETLSEDDKDLNKRGYPLYGKTGFYTDEPVFGDLIRTALKLGYTVLPYDYGGSRDTFAERDKRAAQNLYDNTLAKDPKAKVLVYAGYSHINKGKGDDDDDTYLAEFFKDISKIDPYTIEETNMIEGGSPEQESEAYKYALTTSMGKEPAVFCNKEGKPFVLSPRSDLEIFHPRSEYQKGRPTWLLMGGIRKYYEFSAELCKGKFPCLVQAFLANEGINAVPIDQIKVAEGKNLPVLVLPAGEFLIRVVDAEGKVVNESKASIK